MIYLYKLNIKINNIYEKLKINLSLIDFKYKNM
jgi:hypothetical protein